MLVNTWGQAPDVALPTVSVAAAATAPVAKIMRPSEKLKASPLSTADLLEFIVCSFLLSERVDIKTRPGFPAKTLQRRKMAFRKYRTVKFLCGCRSGAIKRQAECPWGFELLQHLALPSG